MFKNKKIGKPKLNLEDILSDKAAVDELMEIPVKNGVFKICFIVIALIILFSSGRLIFLNIAKGEIYRSSAAKNITEIIYQKTERGLILDRFDKPLVKNKPIFNAFLNFNRLPKEKTERQKIINKIIEILELKPSEFEKIINETDWEVSERFLLAQNLPQPKAATIQGQNLAGLQIENDWQRDYSANPEVFSHILGYLGLPTKKDLKNNPNLINDDIIGKTGLEAYYDSWLRGENGATSIFRNVNGKILSQKLTKEKKSGNPLKTFIDADLQEYFFNRLKLRLKELGSPAGLGLAMNPQNGEILALISLPAFDGNKVADFFDKPYQPVFNRVISGQYNPGSTIKPLMVAAALKEKVVNTKTEFFSPGYLEIPNPYHPDQPTIFLDYKPNGWVNLYSAIGRSCNVYFYKVGELLGINRIKEYWQYFGLGSLSQIDLTGEKKGLLPEPTSQWRLGDTYNISIGQGDLLVTPIQLLNYISAIANKGKLLKPRLAENQMEVLKDLSDFRNIFEEVEKGMLETTQKSYGTAYLLNDLPIKIAAKTGTAQIEQKTKINALFVGYGPVPNPSLAILILIENAREGSINTIPIAKDVFMWYYQNRIK